MDENREITNWKRAIRDTKSKGYRKTKNGRYEAFSSNHSKYVYLGTYTTSEEAKSAVFDYKANRLASGVDKYGLNVDDGVIYDNNYIAFKNGMIFNLHGEKINGGVNKSGYRQGIFNGHTRDHHKIIADCFIPNKDSLRDINHKNGNKLDLNVENLERTTHSDNVKHAYRTGLEKVVVGEAHHNHKLTDKDIRYIRNSTESSYKIAKELNMDSSTVRDIRNGRTWRHVK